MEKRKKWYDALFIGKNGERPIDNILGEKLIYITFGIMFLICVFIKCSITSQASTQVSTVLPYACITNPDALTQEQLDFIVGGIYQSFGDDISNIPFVVFKGYEGIWYTYSEYTETPCYRVYTFNSDNPAVLFSAGTNFSNFAFGDNSKYIDVTFTGVKVYSINESTIGEHVIDNYRFSVGQVSEQAVKRFYGSDTPIVVGSGRYAGQSYNWNYPVYCNKKLKCTDSTLFTGYFCTQGQTTNGELHPYNPADDIDDGDVDGDEITPYTPPTPPSWDDTISAGENIKNYIQWLGSVISGSIGNLANNIKKQFDNLIGNLKTFLNKIIGALNNGFQNIFDNIKGLFQPILSAIEEKMNAIIEKWEYLTEEVDKQAIISSVTSSDAWTDITAITTAWSDFKGVFDSTSEPNTYIIPLHLENVAILHTGVQNIDLSVINPVKPLIRTFAWVMTTFGLFVTICDALPNYINGGGDE